MTLGVAQVGVIPESNKVGGFMAFYHAVASLTQAFAGRQLVPLGPPLLDRL